MRESIDPGSWAVFAERGKKAGMIHAHVTQHGPRVPKDALNDAAQRAGMGWSSINPLSKSPGWSAYVGKGFAGYVGKGFSEAEAASNVALNGGRIGHFSRGFWGLSADGATLSVREAERAAIAAANPDGGGTWELRRTGLGGRV
jgi:hypothetical protein